MNESKQVTVLYVDDEDSNLFIFERTFEEKYNVLTAMSAKLGLAKLEEHATQIIVVISDMRMPVMNGIEFIKIAKEKYKNIAYFILTGFDYNDEIQEALKSKLIHKFFTKPFDINEIDDAIYAAVSKLDL